MISDAHMMALTEDMRVKYIRPERKDYLERYFAKRFDDGREIWIHRYFAPDPEIGLHNHPWKGRSIIIRGGYTVVSEINNTLSARERKANERLNESMLSDLMNGDKTILQLLMATGYTELIDPMTWHRIAEVKPETWTLMVIEPGRRLPMWHKEIGGGYDNMKTADPDWWADCGTRGQP